MCDEPTKTNTEIEADKKRKRSDNTSVSDLDNTKDNTENNTSVSDIDSTKEKQKKKSKKSKEETKAETKEESKETKQEQKKMSKGDDLKKELKAINDSLSMVLKKDDPYLENLIKSTFDKMKDDFLKSVSKRIDILEAKLFDKEKEADALKEKIKQMDKQLDDAEDHNRQLKREMEKTESKFIGQLNDYEQHGRRNNIRINGLKDDKDERSEETAAKLINAINLHIEDIHLRMEDIDIAHRLGTIKDGKPRQIIARFTSRYHVETIFRNKKKSFAGTGIFISEDLTKLNMQALMCVKKKLPDEVDGAWTIRGQVRYKNKSGNIHTLKYEEYESWFDLPWPVPVPEPQPV